MATISYWPEMGQNKPLNTDGNARYGGSGHQMIETPHTLKGRGIKFIEVIEASRLNERGQYKAGWNYYRVSDRAYEALELRYTFAREALLD